VDGAEVDALVAAATAVRRHAYCPYSGYPVGAAVLTAGGDIVAGCNVENASYPAGICAERAAIAAAVSTGSTVLRGLAVVTLGPEPAAPCGLCRQTAAEFDPHLPVVLATVDGRQRLVTLDQLLPDAFTRADLPAADPPRR
jgi:cytidine deaminase